MNSLRIKWMLVFFVLIWALFNVFPTSDTPFDKFLSKNVKAEKDEFTAILERAQQKIEETGTKSILSSLIEIGDEYKIDFSKFFPNIKLADIKNLKKKNSALLQHLYKQSKSVFKQGLDLQGGVAFTLEINKSALEGKSDWEKSQLVSKAVEVISSRIDSLGVSEPIVRPRGLDSIEVQLPGLNFSENPDVLQALKKPAKLEFKLVNDDIKPEDAIPFGYERLWMTHEDNDGSPIDVQLVVKRLPELTGKAVKSAHPVIDQYGKYEISLQFTEDGSKKFSDITKKNLHKRLGIILDGKPYSAPVIQSEITTGQASISGRFSQREAIELSNVLNNPLEFELSLAEMYEVGPSLAQDSRQIAFQGAWIGCFFIMLFLAYYYREVGIVGVTTLIFNFILILACWSAIGATITLPSITALALTFGMSVDANILILERIREEQRAGKSLAVATRFGHERAFITILDSNLTTLITALLLIWLGTGSVKGFGVTLAIGILTTMFAVLVYNKAFIEWLLRFKTFYILEKSVWTRVNFDFMKCRKYAFMISAFVILLGVVATGVRGKKIFGIDFLGGDEIIVRYKEAIPVGKIVAATKNANLGEINPVYQKYIGDRTKIELLKVQTESGKSEQVFEFLQNNFKDAGYELGAKNKIGASVSAELQANAIWSVLAALVCILLYVAFRFEFGYGIGAVLALVHDTIATIGLYILCGKQFSAPMVAAVLMVIGYSINDTIVIFDRIREELALNKKLTLYEVINLAINKTLTRTILTSATTFIPAVILAFCCSGIISDYALIFVFGVVTGTFSSIFIASPIFYWWHKGDRNHVEAKNDKLPDYEWLK